MSKVIATLFNSDDGHLGVLSEIMGLAAIKNKILTECQEVGEDWLNDYEVYLTELFKIQDYDTFLKEIAKAETRGYLEIIKL